MLECKNPFCKRDVTKPIHALYNGGLCDVCYDPAKEAFFAHQASQRSNRTKKGWANCGKKKKPFETAACRAFRLKQEGA